MAFSLFHITINAFMSRLMALGLAFFFCSSCQFPKQQNSDHVDYTETSLIRLLAVPDVFNGREVVTYGFLAIGKIKDDSDTVHNLYININDADHRLIANSVWVDVPLEVIKNKDQFSHQYVGIRGMFRMDPYGTMGLKAGGTINQVSIVMTLGDEPTHTYPSPPKAIDPFGSIEW